MKMALNEAHEKTLNAAAGYGYAVENYTSTVKRSFAPIWGRYGTAFPQGTSESVDVSISISASAILPDGYTLDVSTSVSKSHQLSGPYYYVGHASKNSYRDFSSLYNYKKHLESSNVMQAYNW